MGEQWWRNGSSVVAVATLLLGVAACDHGTPGPGEGAGGSVVLDSADVHVLGTSESIADVRDLEVLPGGSVWLLNSVEPFFVGFDPEGGLLGAHGEAGGGPEEFGLPSAFVTGGLDGNAWVFDLRRHILVEVSDPEGSRSEVRIPRDSIPPGSVRGGMDMLSPVVRTAATGEEVILPRTSALMQDVGVYDFKLALLGADLMALDPASGTVRNVVSLGQALGDPTAGFELSEGGFPLWYRLWAVCGDEEIRVYDRSVNRLRGFTLEGTELDPVALPPVTLTEATPRQFARVVFGLRAAEVAGAVGRRLTSEDSTRLMNEMVEQIDGSAEELANYLPRYVDFRCGDGGTMWLKPFDLEAGDLGGGRLWLRVAPDGAIREVQMPLRFDPYRFTGGRIWGVQRDELDVASVAWVATPGLEG